MGAMFGDDQRPRFGQVEHLAGGMVGGHRLAQRSTAPATDFGKVIDRGIRRFGAAQRPAGMAFLAAGPLARAFAQAADTRRLLQTIAGWRLAAVAAVQPKLTFQFRHPHDQRSVLGAQLSNDRFIASQARRVAIRSLSSLGQCHQHLDSRPPVVSQCLSNQPYLGSYIFSYKREMSVIAAEARRSALLTSCPVGLTEIGYASSPSARLSRVG